MNKFIGLGNLTREPKFREVKGDNKVCDFAIAINNKANNSVFYIDIETWNAVAENCNRFLSKGRKVLVEGKLNMSTWQTKSGENRSRTFCRADTVTFLDKSEDQESSNAPKASEPQKEVEDEFADVPF